MKELSREALEQLSQDMSNSLGRRVTITAPSEAPDEKTGAETTRAEKPAETSTEVAGGGESVETSKGVAVGGTAIGTVAMVGGLDARHGSDVQQLGTDFGPGLLIVAGVAWLGRWQRRKGRSR